MDGTTRRTLRGTAASLGIVFALGGCRAGPTDAAPPQARWPLLLGDGSATVHALQWSGETGVVAGEAPHGLTVAGRTLSDVAGGYLLGLDADGDPRWVRTLEGSDGVQVDALASVPEGGVVFAGHFEGHVRSGALEVRSAGGRDCIVGRADVQGRLLWLERWGTPGTDLCRAAVTTDGQVWVAGSQPDAAREAFSDVLLLRFDLRTGGLQGQQTLGGGGDDHGRALAVDSGGRVALGGMYGGRYDPEGAQVVPQTDATLRWGDAQLRPPAADYDAFVIVFGEGGAIVGASGWSTPGFDTVKDLAATAENGWVAAGIVQPGWVEGDGPGLAADHVPLGGIVVGLAASDATERWRFAESALSSASAVVVLPSGAIWVTGHARRPLGGALRRGVRGDTAAVVFGLDPRGVLSRVVASCDGVGADQGHAVTAGPGGDSLWWAGAVSPDAACLHGTEAGPGAHAGALFRVSTTSR